jgi:spermidine synthase
VLAHNQISQLLRPRLTSLYTRVMGREEQVVHQVDTDYGHYEVVDMLYEGRPSRVLFSGQRNAAQAGVALDDEPDLLFDYNQRLLEIASSLYPNSILIIGGGAFTLATALVTALPESSIDVIEIDPALTQLAKTYFGLADSPRLNIINTDGRSYVTDTKKQYDLVVLDAFHDTTMPVDLSTIEAVIAFKSILNLNGVVAVNIISAYFGRGAQFMRSQYAAYQSLFRSIAVYPAARSLLSYWLPQNFVLVAQIGTKQTIKARFNSLEPLTVSTEAVLKDQA